MQATMPHDRTGAKLMEEAFSREGRAGLLAALMTMTKRGDDET